MKLLLIFIGFNLIYAETISNTNNSYCGYVNKFKINIYIIILIWNNNNNNNRVHQNQIVKYMVVLKLILVIGLGK